MNPATQPLACAFEAFISSATFTRKIELLFFFRKHYARPCCVAHRNDDLMFDRGRGRGVQRGNRRRSDCTDTRTQTQRRRRKKQKSPQRSRSDETLQESIYRKASGKQKRKTKAQHAAGEKKYRPAEPVFPSGVFVEDSVFLIAFVAPYLTLPSSPVSLPFFPPLHL